MWVAWALDSDSVLPFVNITLYFSIHLMIIINKCIIRRYMIMPITNLSKIILETLFGWA